MPRNIKSPLPSWILYAWFLFFVLNPFLVFGSGMPQPADWLMAILFIYLFITGFGLSGRFQKELITRHGLFVIYVSLLNIIWFFFIDQSQEKRFPTIVHSLFYIFNFFVLRASLILSNVFKQRFLVTTIYGIGVGLILQTFLAFVLGSTGSRTALFFDNPNQLGYYALLSGSLFIYVSKGLKVSIIFQLLTYFSFFFLTLLSSSKAALAGSVILILVAILNQGLLNFKQLIVTALAIGIGYYFVIKEETGSQLFNYSYNRFELIGESRDDTYEGRGYDRILNEPGYMLVGAGEGGYYRFNSLLEAGEIHSSFGTIIFCYGIIGFTLFIRFLFKIFNGVSFFEFLYFVPVFAYSITHQGLRDTLFWVFLGVVFILNEKKIISQYNKVRILANRQLGGLRKKKPSVIVPTGRNENV